jgi:hypothetical protein
LELPGRQSGLIHPHHQRFGGNPFQEKNDPFIGLKPQRQDDPPVFGHLVHLPDLFHIGKILGNNHPNGKEYNSSRNHVFGNFKIVHGKVIG